MGVQYYGDTIIGWIIDRKKLEQWLIKNKKASQSASSSSEVPEKKVDSDFDTEEEDGEYEEDIDIENEIYEWHLKLNDEYNLKIRSYDVYDDKEYANYYLGIFNNKFEFSEVPVIQTLLETPNVVQLALELGAESVSPVITSDSGKC
jgi:hypothetical protein